MKSFVLNNTVFEFDAQSGVLCGLSYGGHSFISSKQGGPLDVAVPTEKAKYAFMRMSPQGIGTKAPEFTYTGESLSVYYSELGRLFSVDLPELEGGVSATVTYTALPDGKSVAMKCRVENHCETTVKQIVFPDFMGLDPIDSKEATRFTSMGCSDRPFIELADTPDTRLNYYAITPAVSGITYSAGGSMCSSYPHKDHLLIGRYYDYGSLSAGFSVFCKWWGWGPDNMKRMGKNEKVYMRLYQDTGKLRLGSMHYVEVKKGEVYESPEYVLTAHEGGWINGAEPYREFVDSNKKRVHDMPAHIQEDIGYRTIWVSEDEVLPESMHYTYSDYVTVAEDMLEHGLHELNLWGSLNFSNLPAGEDIFCDCYGGKEAFLEAVAKLKEMGVNHSPLVSIFSVPAFLFSRYGYSEEDGQAGWMQNRSAIPCFQAPYLKSGKTIEVDQSIKLWQDDARAILRHTRDVAQTPSVCWDQYLAAPCEGNIADIIQEYMEETIKTHPEVVISGESTYFFEAEINHLDYTWDWNYIQNTGDMRAYNYVVRTTRPNIIVDRSTWQAKLAFMDNMFINVYPSKPGNVNGSAMISDYPEYSLLLKRLTKIRKQYLKYFTEGDILGDCALAADCNTARVTFYKWNDSYLLFAYMNEDGTAVLDLNLEDGEYHVEWHNVDDPEFVSEDMVSCKGKLTVTGKKQDLFYAIINVEKV